MILRIWSEERCSQTADAVTLEEATERSRELRVAVVDEEPRPELLIFEPHHHIPPLLLDPPIVRVIRRRAEKHLARADMNEREAIRDPDTERSDHVLGEEVARDERVDMKTGELLPGGLTSFPSAQRRGRQAFVFQDPPYRGSPELASEDLYPGFEEADAGVPARGAGFKKEVQNDVEPAEHSK